MMNMMKNIVMDNQISNEYTETCDYSILFIFPVDYKDNYAQTCISVLNSPFILEGIEKLAKFDISSREKEYHRFKEDPVLKISQGFLNNKPNDDICIAKILMFNFNTDGVVIPEIIYTKNKILSSSKPPFDDYNLKIEMDNLVIDNLVMDNLVIDNLKVDFQTSIIVPTLENGLIYSMTKDLLGDGDIQGKKFKNLDTIPKKKKRPSKIYSMSKDLKGDLKGDQKGDLKINSLSKKEKRNSIVKS